MSSGLILSTEDLSPSFFEIAFKPALIEAIFPGHLAWTARTDIFPIDFDSISVISPPLEQTISETMLRVSGLFGPCRVI